MDDDWGDWPEDEYGADTGDTADTADLGGDEPASTAGFGTFEEPAATEEPGGDPPAEPTAGAGEGYLEDDPMAGFGGEPDAEPSGPAETAAEPTDAPDAELHDGGDGGDASPETVVGADPDVDPDADWAPPEFPEQLDVSPPEPVDGYPWSDANAVAAPGSAGPDPSVPPAGAPPTQDLLDYAGAEGGGDPWAALVGSEDPAASSLGRWWSPG